MKLRKPPTDVVAIILASAIGLALNLMVGGLVWSVALKGDIGFGEAGLLGENTTQVLTGWGGGIIGVLGAYIGYRFGQRNGKNNDEDEPLPPKSPEDPK